jgi:hypothetical protein
MVKNMERHTETGVIRTTKTRVLRLRSVSLANSSIQIPEKRGSMKSTTAVILAIVVLHAGAASTSTPLTSMPQGEGLKKQATEQVGPYVIGNNSDRSKQEAEVRTFLWDHWREHRAARVSVTWISKEGAQSNSVFLLEDDQDGAWSIQVTIDRPTSKDSRHGHTEYRVNSVQRVKVPDANWQGTYDNIADDVHVPGNAFLLVLKDANGNTKTKI